MQQQITNRKPDLTMNDRSILTTVAATLLAAVAINTHAQIWETVLDYQYSPGYGSGGGWGVATDALGNVFVGGTGFDTSNVGHGLVLKTDTTAATWYVSDDFNPTPPYTISDVRGM